MKFEFCDGGQDDVHNGVGYGRYVTYFQLRKIFVGETMTFDRSYLKRKNVSTDNVAFSIA